MNLTFKQIVQEIETALKARGIDPEAQPVRVSYIDVSTGGFDIDVHVDTRDMPTSCEIAVSN